MTAVWELDPPQNQKLVLLADGTVEFHEVKGGFFRDDAKVKLRVAAQESPMFRFKLFQKTRQGWQVKEL